MKGKSGAVRSARLEASAESQHFCLFMSFPPLTYIPVNHTAHQYFQGFFVPNFKIPTGSKMYDLQICCGGIEVLFAQTLAFT